MEGITFGKAEPSDAPVIFEMCRETVDKYEDVSSFDYDAAMDWVKRKIEKKICLQRFFRKRRSLSVGQAKI